VPAMVLVKPATIQWHRTGFRLYWRWQSTSCSVGRPKISSETRDLICKRGDQYGQPAREEMSMANPLWGAPRIHGELLKLGVESTKPLSGDTGGYGRAL
jgi:putative transposase